MRTIHHVKDEDKKIEGQRNYGNLCSLADRMGMNRIRDELEDLSFSILNSEARNLILNRLSFIKIKKILVNKFQMN